MRTKLKTIGFEIEGEFTDKLQNLLERENYGIWKTDGSLRRCGKKTPYHIKNRNSYDLAEFNSIVYTITNEDEKSAIASFFDLLQKQYEDGNFHWNRTAGFHIHTGYYPKLPIEIFSKEFHDAYIKKLSETFPKEFEMRAHNRFCKAKQSEEEIASIGRQYSVERYKAINFTHAFNTHGTIEFRIFPSSEPNRMREFVFFTIDFIENFLENIKLERKFELSFKEKKYRRYKKFNEKVEGHTLEIRTSENKKSPSGKSIVCKDITTDLIPTLILRNGYNNLGIDASVNDNVLIVYSEVESVILNAANLMLPSAKDGINPVSGEYLNPNTISREEAYIKDELNAGRLIKAPSNPFESIEF